MRLIYIFSGCLILGMIFSQLVDFTAWEGILVFLADVMLAYIMIEVGFEFVIDKQNWRSYIKDYWIAFLCAALPWIFCFIYFLIFFKDNTWAELLLIARFTAPTSSAILFSMLAAAGLAMTWLFRKIEILAILDDIDTILLLIPLQFLLSGPRYALLSVAVFVIVLIFLAWRFLHQVRLPSGRLWFFFYSILLAIFVHLFHFQFAVELEILVPAFALGCVLYNPHDVRRVKGHIHEHAYIEPEERPLLFFDRFVKISFMLLVGLLLPRLSLDQLNFWLIGFHVVMITILSNLGKGVPIFCYKNEASLRERTAISVAICTRGEIGAGILILAIEHGAAGQATTVSGLSLVVNLVLTGVFMALVIRLARTAA